MFTLNDLLDQVECQGKVVVCMNKENGNIVEVFRGSDLRQVPYYIGCKELAYIHTDYDESYDGIKEIYTVYEVNE